MAGQKGFLGVALALLSALIGFIGGGLVAGLTVKETGLAAGGIVFLFMVIGAILAGVLGIVLSVTLPRDRVKQCVWGALGLAVLALAFVAVRLWQVQRDRLTRVAAPQERMAESPGRPLPPAESLAEPPEGPSGKLKKSEVCL